MAAALQGALELRMSSLPRSGELRRQLVLKICLRLGFDRRQCLLADLCARVYDIGMVAVPDSVLLSPATLSPQDWELINRHPLLGARILARLPGLVPIATVVGHHHEHWDGRGYPSGLRGTEIPPLSRVIAVVDAFVAIADGRPHRPAVGVKVAFQMLSEASGEQFEPKVIDALAAVLTAGTPSPGRAERAAIAVRPDPMRRAARPRLERALAELSVIPMFAPAYERILTITRSRKPGLGSDLVTAIESDLGLMIAILRRAQREDTRRPVTNVASAVGLLGPAEIERVASALTRIAFPWRTPFEAALHVTRLHGQAVAAAAARLALDSSRSGIDDLIAASLLHDVGKLVMLRAYGERSLATDPRAVTPERRLDKERRLVDIDHAACGGMLLERWGLPEVLRQMVAEHHRSTAVDSLPTFVRLADMVARHAQGDAVDRDAILTLAAACRISPRLLRDTLFEVPRVLGGLRRAELSPLSPRETAVLLGLSEGKVYKQIASDLCISEATVRTHAHNAYTKLEVGDRAHAVLVAMQYGWI